MTDVKTVATEVEKVVEGIARVEPFVSTMAMFIPGAAPVMAVVHPVVVALAPLIEKALNDIATGNNTDGISAFILLAQHISKGFPNLVSLAAANTQAAQQAATMNAPSQDPSAQGSG